MREIVITKNEEGYKLRKLCLNYLSQAPASFIYKMLRKKNIVLNDKKASGDEVLKCGDSVKFYLSDDTIEKFSLSSQSKKASDSVHVKADEPIKKENKDLERKKQHKLDVVYEDPSIIICNKPAGILSQKAKVDDYSINEMIIDYLLDKNDISQDSMKLFKPSVANRLDRNTSGIILASKTPQGAQFLSEAIRNRLIKKYYLTAVYGKCDLRGIYKAFLIKDEKTNKVTVTDRLENIPDYYKPHPIETGIKVLEYNSDLDISLLEIELITGKSHQIRSHLEYMGFPIVGDIKYFEQGKKASSNKAVTKDSHNGKITKRYNIKHQMLTAYRIYIPEDKELEIKYESMKSLFNKSFRIDIPKEFTELFTFFSDKK